MKALLDTQHSLGDLYNTIKHGKGDVSFFGVRYAYLEKGQAISLDTIVSFVLQLLRKNPHFDKNERDFGRKLVEKIDRLYSEAKISAKNRNLITQILYMISECWINNFQGYGYGIRFKWSRQKNFADLYTKNQYEAELGVSPTWQADNYKPDLPQRWLLREVRVIRPSQKTG